MACIQPWRRAAPIIIYPLTPIAYTMSDHAPKALHTDRNHRAEQDALHFQMDDKAVAQRLDKALARLMPEHSRTRLQGWIAQGHVTVNGQVASIKRLLLPGDVLRVVPQLAPETLAFAPEPVAFTVLGESPDWIVIDKPAGLVTHPGAGNWHGTLLNGLLYRYPALAQVARAGIVHRLDKETSGLLVVARHAIAQTHLVRQLQERSVSRHYLALVHGHLYADGTVDAPIGRDARTPVRMSVTRAIAPKPAITHYAPQRHGVTQAGQPVTQVFCQLQTGRTHQIRVHLAFLGHPLLGDTLYGARKDAGAARQMLHAQSLMFQDPSNAKPVQFTSSLPDDFVAVQHAVTWMT